jgi:flagellin
MRINTNVASLNAQENAVNTGNNLRSSLEKLSSGLRINKASDDASGMAIADKLRTQASSLSQAVSNGNSAVSLVQIADKAMAEQSNILDVIKTKLLQSGTATTSSAGRDAIAKDITKLLDQLDNIARQTNYNGIQLLQSGTEVGGSAATALTFQMGETADNTITTSSGVASNVKGLGLSGLRTAAAAGGDIRGTAAGAASAARGMLKTIDDALTTMNGWRSDFGSTQNQLESSIRNLATAQTNLKAAESVIRDVDYAQESANFNKQNIIAQAGTYAQSQANAIQQNVLRLLQ